MGILLANCVGSDQSAPKEQSDQDIPFTLTFEEVSPFQILCILNEPEVTHF